MIRLGLVVVGLLGFMEGEAAYNGPTSLRGNVSDPCHCEIIIPASTVTVGKCADCSRCAWNLHTYGFTFKDKDPAFFNDGWFEPLEKMFKECTEDIAYPPTFYDNEDCVHKYEICLNTTKDMFEYQCNKIFSPKLPPPPEPQERVSMFQKSLDIHKTSMVGLPRNFKFNGRNLYTLTCPMYYRKFSYTYSLLYEQAYKFYGVNKTQENAWTETTTVAHVALKLRKQVIIDAHESIHEAYDKYNVPLNKQKFCGHYEVYVCIDFDAQGLGGLLHKHTPQDHLHHLHP